MFDQVSPVDGGPFDETGGEPDAWQTPLGNLAVHEWARRWLTEQGVEWQPRTRTSPVEALARFTIIAIRAGAKPSSRLRAYLFTALNHGAVNLGSVSNPFTDDLRASYGAPDPTA